MLSRGAKNCAMFLLKYLLLFDALFSPDEFASLIPFHFKTDLNSINGP